MWNIIRSQWYQLKRDRRVRGAFIGTFLFNGAFTLANIDTYGDNMHAGMIVADLGGFYCVMGLLFMLVLMASVMGTDFVDKTINYEILSGHPRKEVFFGRFIVAALAGSAGALAVMLFFPCAFAAAFGWGNEIEAGGMCLRCVLVCITLLRIACELALVSVIVKNPYVTIFAGYILGGAQFIIQLLQPLILHGDNLFRLFSVCLCMELLSFDAHLNEAGEIVGSSLVEPQLAIMTVAGAVIVGGLAVVAACAYFKRDDLH